MHSILHDLCNGKIRPFDRVCPDSKAYHDQMARFRQCDKALQAALHTVAPDLCDLYDNCLNQLTLALTYETEEMFCYGFCLGANIMTEVLLKYPPAAPSPATPAAASPDTPA